MENYFTLLGVTQTYNISSKKLKEQYLEAQSHYHPDNANTEDADMSVRLNQAYETLRVPHLRAKHLLALQGIDFDKHAARAQLTPLFLQKQLAVREELESVLEPKSHPSDVKFAIKGLEAEIVEYELLLKQHFSSENTDKILSTLVEMQFYIQMREKAKQWRLSKSKNQKIDV